jgi:predicted fused transcriptional regulator/phosphomethylpyrimidine kinase
VRKRKSGLNTSFYGLNPETKKIAKGGQSWTIFITFNEPVAIGQVVVDSGGGKVPGWQVQDTSARSAIVVFKGEMTGVVLSIRVIPPSPT